MLTIAFKAEKELENNILYMVARCKVTEFINGTYIFLYMEIWNKPLFILQNYLYTFQKRKNILNVNNTPLVVVLKGSQFKVYSHFYESSW